MSSSSNTRRKARNARPPARFSNVAFEVDDVRATVARLRERGFDLVGELR